jgi:hypothetical protein
MAANDPLRAYLRVQRKYDVELNRSLERTARSIRARIQRLPAGIGGEVRKAQLQLALNEITRLQSEMWAGPVRSNIQAGRKAAAEAAVRAAETLERVAYAALPEWVAQALTDGLRATAMAGIEADMARLPRELSTRVYRTGALQSGAVEQRIRAGLQAGLSAKELARDVYGLISPRTPGGVSYAASRLARTEINNAFHERQIQMAKDSPAVTAVVWNLSGSHPRPDECNTFAEGNKYDLGRGAYPTGSVPSKPHPHCFCYLTYKTLSPTEFAAALERGDFNDELDRRTQANLRSLGTTRGR